MRSNQKGQVIEDQIGHMAQLVEGEMGQSKAIQQGCGHICGHIDYIYGHIGNNGHIGQISNRLLWQFVYGAGNS